MGCPVVDATARLNPQQQTDILRYWLLWKKGGIWVDADIVCLRPFDFDFDEVVAFSNSYPGNISPCVIGCRQGSPIMEEVYERCLQKLHSQKVCKGFKFTAFGNHVLRPLYEERPEGWTIYPRWAMHGVGAKQLHMFTKKFVEWNADVRRPRFWKQNAYGYHLQHKTVNAVQGQGENRITWDKTFLGFLLRRSYGIGIKPGRAQVILKYLPRDKPCTMIEIGVSKARNAAVILQQRPKLKMILIDPYLAGTDHHATQAKGDIHFAEAQQVLAFAKDRVQFIRKLSEDAAHLIPNHSQDVVFIDGNHEQPYVERDIHHYESKVKPGGRFMGHDFGPGFPGVRQAVIDNVPNFEVDKDCVWHAQV
jgi:hypothetical protein